LQTSRGYPINGHLGGSNTKILNKNDPQILVLCKWLPNLVHLLIQSNHKNTFRTMLDGISSKIIAKQSGVPYYWHHWGVKYQNFDKKNWGGNLPKMTPNIDI
jgi:hypothetical protein